ncbi:CHAT domain-containing protein [Phormidium sp. CCY1219]|uniref:CHAT domain-containing protein n=1 Tax=Phormidium sp. CCY1219 TaxID=2886104 RepID=UPI002D1F7950|nr:CHAT domain-containing protein [Phormidium sp. CCY1219]MEB3827388.1 CHAT domain-containing protein [Phormidium sp. CCY1219]
MDEQRSQAYLSLIQELLECPSGEEPQILEAHLELLDEGFVQVCQLVAAQLQEEGQDKRAQFLRNVAQQVGAFLRNKESQTQLYGETYSDGFPKNPQEAVRLSEGLSEIEKQEWYEWIETATPEQKAELVDILHSMWLQSQGQVQEVETFLRREGTEENQQRDEQRVQAYLWLIQELLACPKGEENDVLTRRQYLVDEGFVQVCAEEAARLQTEGRENEAQFLRNVAQGIGEYLNRQTSGESMVESQANGNETEQEYLNFLMQVLGRIVESDSNPSMIYPLLQQNLDKLDLNFAETLQKWAVQIFNEVESNKASVIALVISELANSIQNFPLGNRDDNLEIAITAYKIALTVLNRQTLPEELAQTKMKLGVAYFSTIGDREKNIEYAITHLKAALEIHTRDRYPEEWARTLMMLALVYGQRIRGNKAENIEQRIVCYEAALQIYTYQRFPKEWALIHQDLAHAYSNRVQGEAGTNVEKAIVGYQAALQVYTYELFPEEWAETQMRLGLVYASRLQGDKSANLEIAINHFQAALTVYTVTQSPEKWAKVQAALGSAYSHSQCIRGNKSENLEQAIACYEESLTVNTLKNFPYGWGMLQKNLGNAYNDRVQGDKSSNQQKAITYYHSALQIYTRETFPEEWADTQMSLGWVYYSLIRGDLLENLERAIAYFEAALQVYVQPNFYDEWADAQRGLGTVYVSRIRGNKAENLEKAIAFCEAALQVYTRETFPENWRLTQMSLGNAYSIRIGGNKAENLEKAITFYEAALQVYTRETYSWAITQMSLGNVYSLRIQGNKAENMEKAITFCEAALQVYTREGFPYESANTQVSLGETYRNRIRGERAENLERAIYLYQEALRVLTRFSFPQDHAGTLNRLGLAYQEQSRYYSNDTAKKQTALQNAYTVVEQALDTVEYLRGEITSGDESKRKLNEEWAGLYFSMVEVCLELGRYTEAIEYADRSKARNLTELIATRDAYPGGDIPAEVRQRLQQLRQAISEEDRRLKQDPNPDYAHISQLREEFQAKYPYKPLKFTDIQSLLDDETVILEWYVLDKKFLTFTLTNQTLKLWTSSEEDRQNLIDWTVAYIDDYRLNNSQWRDSLLQRLETLAQILHLDEILHNLRQNFPNCKKLILIPHRFLHLFPLHALPVTTGAGEGLLQDLFPKGVAYAPNCQVLQQAQNRQRPDFNELFAIQNPTQDLDFTDMEVEAIQSLFNPHQVLKHDQAEKAALDGETLKNAHCTHFSCHGYFNFEDALKSALILAKSEFTPPPPTDDPSRYLPLEDNKLLDLQKCLTLEDILRLDLTNCRLVTLSACETGITDFTSTSDEYIGLPSGFILAGSPNVVSTLWAVADISTAIFMIQFYQTLQQSDLSVVLALRQTQKWLREATVQDLLDWTDSCAAISPERREEMEDMIDSFPLDYKPFESPYYWAAFCAIGQ